MTDTKPEEQTDASANTMDLFGKKKKKKKTTKDETTTATTVTKTKKEVTTKKDTKEEKDDNINEEDDNEILEEDDDETKDQKILKPVDDDTAFVDDEDTTKSDNNNNKQENGEAPKSEGEIKKAFAPIPSGRDYTYEELAHRIFSLINSSRPEEKTVYKMKPPVVYREGTSKTVWVNFPEICKIMSRSPEHVLSFVLAEVGSTGSIDGSARLVIKGKFQPKHIENILRRYISEYVKCHTCKSPETTLKKENRLLFMVCDKCGSSRSVTAIKSGFQATTRASRRQQQNK